MAVVLAAGVGCGARTELDFGATPSAATVDAGRDAIVLFDAGMDAAADVGPVPPVLQNIDPACGTGENAPIVYPPYVPLTPPDLPAGCSNGFELGDADHGSVYVIESNVVGGAAAITLDVQYATYKEPDGTIIEAVGPTGTATTIFDSCRMQTWTSGDPSGGVVRPPDATIRQFKVAMPAGTSELIFNFGGVVSPMYIQVLGLCDFDVTPFSAARWWQAVP
jgi:hypothetical protein